MNRRDTVLPQLLLISADKVIDKVCERLLLVAGSTHAARRSGEGADEIQRIKGGSPVRELRSPGSVRGVSGDRYPYRDSNARMPQMHT